MAKHNELGKLGEQAAYEYLLSKGYRIIARNWRFIHKEVDIIAYDNDELVIIEVKTRSSNSSEWEHPRDSITSGKIRFLILAAEKYIIQNKIDNNTRFDLICCIAQDNNKWDIEHIVDAFSPQVE